MFLLIGQLAGSVDTQGATLGDIASATSTWFAGKFERRDQAEAAAAGLSAWAAAAGRAADLDLAVEPWPAAKPPPYTLPVGCLLSYVQLPDVTAVPAEPPSSLGVR